MECAFGVPFTGTWGARPRLATLRLLHLAGDRALAGGATREAIDNAGDVFGRAVLTELPLGFKAVHDELHADDGLQVAVDVLRRSIGDGPRLLTPALVEVSQPGDEIARPTTRQPPEV